MMEKIRWFMCGMVGLTVLMGCKSQSEGSKVAAGERDVKNYVCEQVKWVSPVSSEELFFPDTETEKKLRAIGFVDIAEIDPSVEICLMYATPENFTGQVLYSDLYKAFLLPETARRVADAQRRLKVLKPHWGLIIYDAARPMSVQQVMWDRVKGTDKQVYVSNPARGGGLHNYGAAVDLSLIDSMGQIVEMGSPVDYFGDEARPDREEALLQQGRLTAPVLENRKLLRRVMKEAGFRPLHSEWWHFNLMSREEAKKKLKLIP